MFEYKLIYYVSSDKYRGSINKSDDDYCILIPELIKDAFDKINGTSIEIKPTDFADNGKFKNGYAIFCKDFRIEKIIREDGTIIANLPKDIIHSDESFSDDRLLIIIDERYAYIDGTTGQIYYLPEEYKDASASSYYNGYAIIFDNGKQFYIDKDLKKKSIEYEYASQFINGRALVCTETEWQIIDSEFNILLTFSRQEFKDDFFNKILSNIEDEKNKASKDSNIISFEKDFGRKRTYINSQTGLSIFMPVIIKSIAKKFNLELPDLGIKEQFIWLINEISKQGTYIYSTKDGSITPVELKTGIMIDSKNGSVTSYDETDVAFLRQRIKEESLDE